MKRRRFISAVLALSCAGASLGVVAAYPERPIHIVAPSTPGGGIDILSRTIGQKMSVELGVPVVIDNRPGGNGNIGIDAAAKAAPDGYTILMGYSGMAINPNLNPKLPYDPEADFEPLVLVGSIPLVLVANPAFPPNTVDDLIKFSRQYPMKVQYGHGGVGGGSHLAGEWFKLITKQDITAVPYKGNAPALADVIAGHVPIMWDTVNTAMPQVRAGHLKALATTAPQRLAMEPGLPTMIEAGIPGFELSAWYMLVAPKKTPAAMLDRLNMAINKAIADPDVARMLGEQGVVLNGGTRDGAASFLKSEIVRWGKVIREAGIKAE